MVFNSLFPSSLPLQLDIMLPLKEKDKPIIRKLLAAGCCARCVLRFCCLSVHSAYRRPQQVRPHFSFFNLCFRSVTHPILLQETLRELQDFISDEEDTTSQNADNKSHDAAEPCKDPPSKRAKLEPGAGEAEGGARDAPEPRVCVACLGVLQELSGASQAKKIAEAVKAETYEFDSLVLSVSLPAQLCVREVSLKNMMAELTTSLDPTIEFLRNDKRSLWKRFLNPYELLCDVIKAGYTSSRFVTTLLPGVGPTFSHCLHFGPFLNMTSVLKNLKF